MVCSIIEMLTATVVKLVNTLDCGSSISRVRVPSVAPDPSDEGFFIIQNGFQPYNQSILQGGRVMKKHLIQAALISLFVNLCLFAFNLINAKNSGVLPLGKTYTGGDCVERIGFGVRLLEIYPETTEGKPGLIKYVYYEPQSLVIPLIIGFVIAFVILHICFKEKAKH